MGLLQKAVETYDSHSALVGVYRDGHEPLAPIGHTLTSADIEITLDKAGVFLFARKIDKSEQKILIPITEESGGRTSAPAAHPLCDQLKYIAPKNQVEHNLYLNAIRTWANSEYSHPFLNAIRSYVESGTILPDLIKYGIIESDMKSKYNEKQMVCWRINGYDNEEPACWKNQKLFAQQMVRLLGKKFPTQRVVLFGFSRGGWYLDELYKELKDHGREVLLAWCNDACPGDDKTVFGYPAIEEDGIPVYVAVSMRDGGKIVARTKQYGESGNPDIVFFKQYDCKHGELSAAAAEDIRNALKPYE